MTQETINSSSHFFGSRDCRWGKTTLLDGYFVSSVGEYYPNWDIGPVQIGFGRLYETCVFRWGGKRCERSDCNCGKPLPLDWTEVDRRPANSREECEANHAALVAKYMGASR